MVLHTAGLLLIKERKLLLAFSKPKQCFYLPGGKLAVGENSTTALCREIEEELNVQLTAKMLQYYTHITAAAFGEPEGTTMEQDCFMVMQDLQPIASAEIGALQYFTVADYQQQAVQAPGALMILKQLQKEDYID